MLKSRVRSRVRSRGKGEEREEEYRRGSLTDLINVLFVYETFTFFFKIVAK